MANKVFAIDMGGGKSSCLVLEDVSPTLTTTHYGEPVIFQTEEKKDGFDGEN